MSSEPKRNDPCPCGSGRRFKACCGKRGRPGYYQQVPDGILVVPDFLNAGRCAELTEIANRMPTIEAGVKDYGPEGEQRVLNEAQRIATIFDVSDAAEHFIPLVDHVFKSRVNPFYGVETERFEFPQVLKYGPGGKHVRHNDAETPDLVTGDWVRRIDRDYSILVYLNDEFTGGDLLFDHFGFRLRPQTGMLVAFPSGHPYEHAALPLETGLRYVIVSWGTVLGTPRVSPKPVGRVVYTEEHFLPDDSQA